MRTDPSFPFTCFLNTATEVLSPHSYNLKSSPLIPHTSRLIPHASILAPATYIL